jgi:uncharacterized membrane protein
VDKTASRPKRHLIDAPVGFWLRLVYVFGPVVVCAAALGLVFLLTSSARIAVERAGSVRALDVFFAPDPQTLYEVLIAGGVSLLGAGSTIVFGQAALGDEVVQLNLGTWHLAAIFIFINAVSTFFYTYNLDLMQRLPKIGPYMRMSRKNAVATLEQRPWIRRWAVVGISIFVITPLPGSGALGGAIMGRIVGVSKRATVISVSIAGIMIGVLYALLADQLKLMLDRLEQFFPPWVRISVAVLGSLLAIWVVARLVRWFASHPSDGNEASEQGSKA